MNIILIITGLGMGGAERQVCDLAEQFVNKGHSVLLISMTGETVNRPQSTKVDVVELNMAKTLLGFIKAYSQARRLIKQFKPDVVHSHMVHANLFARLLRVTTRIKKLICTAHSSNEGGCLRMLAYRLTDRLCDISTNVSQEAVDISVKRRAAPASRIIAIPNGIDTVRFTFNSISRVNLRAELQLADKTPLILAVGRFTEAKDYPNLLTAFSELPIELNYAQLAIIGTGEQQTNIGALVAQLRLTNRVHFLGLQRNVHEWMSAADIYVMSSAWEGMPLVLLEAMACERMVVATDCGGVKEVLGDCGILVPPKNSAALAKGLEQALRYNQESVKVKGQFARERIIACYSLCAQAERWLKLYQSTSALD
ncbi:glycosyltransferase [Aeromonas salmonicida]|uniref:glycosyltransferase n=1 Tax=Aeromonas salmonicida TaxID=645 RepID=UPI00073138D3|nr:glycosyltransferase [Aeromonas salmonicida]KTA77459.1 glycosyl transferase [Aeromonas salmonicida]